LMEIRRRSLLIGILENDSMISFVQVHLLIVAIATKRKTKIPVFIMYFKSPAFLDRDSWLKFSLRTNSLLYILFCWNLIEKLLFSTFPWNWS
jgi:hypothetical protein